MSPTNTRHFLPRGDTFWLLAIHVPVSCYRPKRSFGQGNIFTSVCHSVHRGVSQHALQVSPRGGGYPSMPCRSVPGGWVSQHALQVSPRGGWVSQHALQVSPRGGGYPSMPCRSVPGGGLVLGGWGFLIFRGWGSPIFQGGLRGG